LICLLLAKEMLLNSSRSCRKIRLNLDHNVFDTRLSNQLRRNSFSV